MDIVIIILIVLIALWYIVRRFRATWQKREHPCSDCDGTTCKHTLRQEHQDGEGCQGCQNGERDRD